MNKPSRRPPTPIGPKIIVALIAAAPAPTDVCAATFLYEDAIGEWQEPAGGATLSLRGDGRVADSPHGAIQGKYSASVADPGGRGCHDMALLSTDKTHLFLAEKGPKVPDWPCVTGLPARVAR